MIPEQLPSCLFNISHRGFSWRPTEKLSRPRAPAPPVQSHKAPQVWPGKNTLVCRSLQTSTMEPSFPFNKMTSEIVFSFRGNDHNLLCPAFLFSYSLVAGAGDSSYGNLSGPQVATRGLDFLNSNASSVFLTVAPASLSSLSASCEPPQKSDIAVISLAHLPRKMTQNWLHPQTPSFTIML